MIASIANSRVKRVVRLKERKKARDQEGVFIIEGSRLFLEAPPAIIEEVYLTEDFLEKCQPIAPAQSSPAAGSKSRRMIIVKSSRPENETDSQPIAPEQSLPPETSRWAETAKKLAALPYETVSEEVFNKLSDTTTPQGILCVVRQSHRELPALIAEMRNQAPFFLLLEDIRDPGNLGTILRTAEGAGIDGVIMSSGCVDIYNPKTIRSTMGSVFRVPFTYTEDLGAAITQLKNIGITVFASCLTDAADYDRCGYQTGTAFLIGNEGNGLKAETIRQADRNLKIPMQGQVESLNAAAAAAILLYEARRQRRRHCSTS